MEDRSFDGFVIDSSEIISNEEIISKKSKKRKKQKSSKRKRSSITTSGLETEGKELEVKELVSTDSDEPLGSDENTKSKKNKKKEKNRDKKDKKRKTEKSSPEPPDSEEERWLQAIQFGHLHQVDEELKRLRDPQLLTARQRVLAKQGTGEKGSYGEEEKPSEKEKPLTEEMLAKRALKTERRRAQALVKREQDKKKTVDRLLRRQEPKGGVKVTPRAPPPLMVSYKSIDEGRFLSFPPGYEYPLKKESSSCPVAIQKCAVRDCSKDKKYTCRKTNLPVCSLECYKLNLEISVV